MRAPLPVPPPCASTTAEAGSSCCSRPNPLRPLGSHCHPGAHRLARPCHILHLDSSGQCHHHSSPLVRHHIRQPHHCHRVCMAALELDTANRPRSDRKHYTHHQWHWGRSSREEIRRHHIAHPGPVRHSHTGGLSPSHHCYQRVHLVG